MPSLTLVAQLARRPVPTPQRLILFLPTPAFNGTFFVCPLQPGIYATPSGLYFTQTNFSIPRDRYQSTVQALGLLVSVS